MHDGGDFVGRERELAEIGRHLLGRQEERAALITGSAGTGKTALASEFCRSWRGPVRFLSHFDVEPSLKAQPLAEGSLLVVDDLTFNDPLWWELASQRQADDRLPTAPAAETGSVVRRDQRMIDLLPRSLADLRALLASNRNVYALALARLSHFWAVPSTPETGWSRCGGSWWS